MNCAEVVAANEIDIDSIPNNGNSEEDDYDCASVFPNQELDLAIEKTVIADNLTPQVGSEVSFEIRVINDSSIAATEVVVTELLPTGYTYLNYSSSKGTYDDNDGRWEIGTVESGETEILVVDAIVNASGEYLNCAEITEMHQTDLDLTNNTSCIATVPIKLIDLELTVDVALSRGEISLSESSVLQPDAGTDVNFTIIVSNEGLSTATGVEVTDFLPDGYDFVSSVATVGSYDDDSAIWAVGTIGSRSLEILEITASVNSVGDWENIAEVTSANELDIDSEPNNGVMNEDDMDSAATAPIIPLFIPNEFTPNGDGINDGFELVNLGVLYPNFSIEIVNRWGNTVYKYKHNGDPATTPIWWDGYSDGRWELGSGELPVATYFYTIYFNDNNNRKPQTGWVYLRR